MTPPDPSALTCYTANLAVYLSTEMPDAIAHIARSIRFALRIDPPEPVFSHHRYSLGALPDGSHLRYAAAPDADAALAGIEAELDRNGRTLVVGNTSMLPWSPQRDGHASAHWLLIDDHQGDRWHLVDRFAAILPAGEQRPYNGWHTSAALAAMLRPRPGTSRVQQLRDMYALGPPVAAPANGWFCWLLRQPAETAGRGDPPARERWVFGADGIVRLPELLTVTDPRGQHEGAGTDAVIDEHLEDIWAVARHQIYRIDWLASTGQLDESVAAPARTAWNAVPMAARITVLSARRGRARPGVFERGIAALPDITAELDTLATEDWLRDDR